MWKGPRVAGFKASSTAFSSLEEKIFPLSKSRVSSEVMDRIDLFPIMYVAIRTTYKIPSSPPSHHRPPPRRVRNLFENAQSAAGGSVSLAEK